MKATTETLSKYKIGEQVFYTPKLSGFNNNQPLTVSYIRKETHDLFGNELEIPTFSYSFVGIDLCATECDIKNYENGDFVCEYITANGENKVVRTCIGFVVGYTHHNKTEALLNKDGESFGNCKVFDTKEQAQKFITKHQSKRNETLYFRCYMFSKYTKI